MDRTKEYSFDPVHNASTPCSLQAFGTRCIHYHYSNIFIQCQMASTVVGNGNGRLRKGNWRGEGGEGGRGAGGRSE